MRSHGLIFQGRAIPMLLDGRKTQTRRIFKVAGESLPLRMRFAAGDRIWAKEAFFEDQFHIVHYRADGALPGIAWVSPLFMLQSQARFSALLRDVRIERIQDISEEDALAEGIERNWLGEDCPPEYAGEWVRYGGSEEDFPCHSARESFATLWDAIHARKRGHSWRENPFVYVLQWEGRDAQRSAHAD